MEYLNPETSVDVAPEDNPTSEPEPGIIVLTRPSYQIKNANPRPADIRLLIEISDSTVGFDLTVKAELYARAGVPDYWVFDIPEHRLVVHREPHDGRYQSISVYNADESVCPLAAPDHEFRVGQAFPE